MPLLSIKRYKSCLKLTISYPYDPLCTQDPFISRKVRDGGHCYLIHCFNKCSWHLDFSRKYMDYDLLQTYCLLREYILLFSLPKATTLVSLLLAFVYSLLVLLLPHSFYISFETVTGVQTLCLQELLGEHFLRSKAACFVIFPSPRK